MTGIAKRIVIASVAGSMMLGVFALPAFAEDNGSTLGQALKACNANASTKLKSIRQDFKDGKITKQDRNSQVKDTNTARRSCIKDAKATATAAQKQALADRKAKLKADQEKRLETAKARSEAQKAKRQVKARHTQKTTVQPKMGQ